jgi:hypothetical protein
MLRMPSEGQPGVAAVRLVFYSAKSIVVDYQ